MKIRSLGSQGIDASVVAFGAWAIGGWKWGGGDADASIAAVRAALDAGINIVDTAPVYGFGLSEKLVAEAIKGRKRDELIIATKCGLRWDIETPTLHNKGDEQTIYRTLTDESIRWELQQSFDRLGVDYIDLYQTHWPDPQTDIEAVANTLQSLKNEGLIRAWGLCNESPEHLHAAAGFGDLATDQERYSLLDRAQDETNLPVCIEHDLGFLCYSPIAQGLLTGKIDAKRQFNDGDLRLGNPRFSPPALDAIQAVLAPVKALARDRDVSTEQLVLAWTLRQPGVTHVLVGARNAEQAVSNAVAGTLDLDDEELNVIQHAADAWPGFEKFTAR